MTGKAHSQQTTPASKKREILYGLSWAITWPLLVGVPALVVMLSIFAASLANIEGEVDPATNQKMIDAHQVLFYGEMVIFFSVTVLVTVLFALKRFMRRNKFNFVRIGATTLGVYIWAGILISGLTMALITRTPELASETTAPNARVDSHIAGTLQSIGGKSELIKNLSLYYVDDYEEAEKLGEYAPVIYTDGTFSHGTITIRGDLDVSTERTAIAHEYLHHIWQTKLDYQTQNALTSQLMTLYGRDGWVRDRTSWYSDTNTLLPTELFSFYCTEAADRHLTEFILNTCSQYIDRSSLDLTRA